jgi:hypothetical protein
VFELVRTLNGYSLQTLVNFNGANGANPSAGLVADANGDLFGTTFNGGTSGDGTVFELTGAGFLLNPPAVVTAVTPSLSGSLGIGQTVTIAVTMSNALTVTGGAPTLLLNDGGTATYDAAATAALNDPTKLVFDYTVGATDTHLPFLAIFGGSGNGASVLDANGDTPDFSGLFTTYSVLSNLNTIAGPPATVTGVAPSVTGTAGNGQNISFTVSFSNAVSVSNDGTPTLLLNDGGTATYDATKTAALGDNTKLVFDYTVSASDRNEPFLAFVGGSLNGATVLDANGNVPDLSNLTSPNTLFAINVVANPPAIINNVQPSQTSGTLHVGDAITFTVTASAGLTVSGGTPTLSLNDGGTATYDAAATATLNDPTKLVFSYTVGASDQTVSMLAIDGGSLNGATITDARGNAPDYSGLVRSFPGLGVDPPPASAAAANLETVPLGIDGANSAVTIGNGNGTVYAGANDLINLGKGVDTVAFGESPNPIAIGNETISGFNPARDVIQFNPLLFANYAAAFANTKQVGADTVIQVDATNSVTLNSVTANALSAKNFHFS